MPVHALSWISTGSNFSKSLFSFTNGKINEDKGKGKEYSTNIAKANRVIYFCTGISINSDKKTFSQPRIKVADNFM